MFLHHEHSEVYYCIDNQTKLEIISKGESILPTFLYQKMMVSIGKKAWQERQGWLFPFTLEGLILLWLQASTFM